MSLSVIVQPVAVPALVSTSTWPVSILAAGNDNVTTISGTTLGAANVFEYKYIADVYVNGILQVTLKAFPDPSFGIGVFNMRNVLTSFMSFDFFPNAPSPVSNIFQPCPNSSVRAQLVFGEEYVSGSTFIQNRNITSGNTNIYINASLGYTDEINTNLFGNFALGQNAGFLTSRSGINFGTFDPVQNQKNAFNTYTNQREVVYFLGNGNFVTGGTSAQTYQQTSIQISTYDILGNNIGKYFLLNPLSGTTDIVMADIGYAALNSITVSGTTVQVVTGTLPMMNASVAYYFAWLHYGTNHVFSSSAFARILYYYHPQVDCGRFAAGAYTITWLNEYGGFNTWLFNKKNETTQNIQRQSYKKVQGKVNANGSYTLNTNSRSEVPYYTVLKDSIVMHTDFITDADVLYLKTLISSPAVYMTDQNGLVTSIVIKDDSYRINKKVNQKIYALEMTVEQSYNDYRQLL